jgi:hypothetical protein
VVDNFCKNASLYVYDVSGKLVYQSKLSATQHGQLSLDAISISKGIYFAKLVADGVSVAVQKVAVQ